ncbi:ribbon-helix-helix protein, CopG family [Aerococcaceae bacterium NML210727]|nr:ribbon-helix-helix protein, CopG family [Aerococcaceae bacterium NML210727]MCW6655095.1 ribbon-helix-helix protein, CopG family [Aerococcaceae bacterium NML201296]
MTDKKKVGRKKAKNPQDRRITVRMTEETYSKFEEYCKREDVTKSEAIRRAVNLLK